MNEEDYNLNLGEVESPAQDQQQVPELAIDEYLNRLRSLGFEDTDAVNIMSRNGYNSQEVYNEMVSQYETQREEYLRRKEEAEQRAKDAEERAEAMSSEKKKSDRFDSSGKPSTGELTDEGLLDTFVPSRATKQQFDDPSQVQPRAEIDESKYQQIFKENPELKNPYSAVPLPADIMSAMEAGEDVGLRYQSYKNDGNIFDNYTAKKGVAAINEAIKRKDVKAYKAIAEDMAQMGYNYPPIEEFNADSVEMASSYSALAFDMLEKQSKSLMEERNLINDQYGLPSNFNPESDVDFMFALKESISRQQTDIDSSELASYQERIEEEAGKLPPGFAGESIVRGFINGAVRSVVDAAKYSLPAMYYEYVGDNENYNAYMSANRRSQDIAAQDKRNRFKERFNLSEDVADMGVSEATEMWINGELSQEDYLSKLVYESGEFFGGALSYMIPIGRVSEALRLAKGAVAKTAAKGTGVLTAEAALAARTADAALRVAKINNAGVLTALGVTSGAATYADLYDRKDLTFSEKMLQSTLVGVAEATLARMLSNVDRLLVSGAARTVRAKTTQEFAKMAKDRLASMTRRKAIGRGLKQTGRGLTEEFLEEFGVEVVAQGAEILNDIAMGRTPKEIDWYALIDAGMAGLIGAGPTSAMAGLGSYQAHSSLLKRRKVLADQLGELDAAIGMADSADERKRLTQIKEGVSAELMLIDGESRASFDNLSEGQRRRLLKIHRDMAYTENALKRKDLSKEEREQLTTRYESLLRAKTEIENSGEKPNLSRDDDSVPVQDASGKDVEVKGEDTTREDDVKLETAEQAEEEAPEEQKQEAVQLSLFDETQEQEEAPAVEEAPAAETKAEETKAEEKAPAEEAPAADQGVKTFNEFGGDLVDVTDSNVVGSGEGKMSLEAAIAVNRMSKAFGGAIKSAGYSFKLYSREAFEATLPDSIDKKKAGGYVDHGSKTINIPADATAAEVIEEFGHVALKDIIGKDAKARKSIYNTLKDIAKRNPGVAQILQETRENELYSKQGEAIVEEESIIAVLVAYTREPEALNKGGFVSKMMAAINKVFARIAGKDLKAIENEEKFYDFARKFVQAARGEQVEITDPGIQAQDQDLRKREDESEEEYRARLDRMADEMAPMTEEERAQQEFEERGEDISGMRFAYGKRKTEFTYLKDTVVYYTEDPYVEIGEYGQEASRTRDKKIKVNDYFHFRNWYNHMNANGRRDRVANMYFIKDGKKYTIKPPKPKTDKDGNVVRMNGALSGRAAFADRIMAKIDEEARAVNEARAKIFKLHDDAKILNRAGIEPASGMVLIPGFDIDEYSKLEDAGEKFEYKSEFRNRVLFNRTLEEQQEVLEIAYENLELLLQSGMSVSEMEAADKASILNMSGRTPSFMQGEGSTTDSGDLRFAYNKKAIPASLKKRGLDLGIRIGKFAEFVGARSVNAGYDRSYESVKSGVLEQAGKEIDGNPVFLSHRTAGMAQNKYKELVREARRDLRRPVKDRKGFVVVTHSVLDVGSIAGNPAIFAQLVDSLINDPSFTEAEIIEAVNDFISGSDSPMAEKNYRKLIRSTEFNRKNSLLNALSRAGTGKIRIESIQEARDFVDVFKQQDEALGIEQNFVDRNAFGRRIVKQILKKEGKEGGLSATNKYLRENFEDKGLSEQAGKYIIAATKIPYTVEGRDENGEPIIGGFKRAYDDSADTPFPHAIVSTSSEFEGMVLIEDQPSLKNAYSKAMVSVRDKKGRVIGTEKAFRAQKKGESKPDYIKYLRERQDFLSRSGVASELSDDKVYSYGKRGGESFSMKEETSFQKWKNLWIRRLQDKYVDIFNIQESIERQKGRVGREQDFKMAEELMYGKAAEDLARLDKRIEEITSMMKKAGVKVDDVSRYLYALHAKERNAVIAERSNGGIKDGSGISDAEADAIINAANKKALDPIVSKIREIQQDTRDTMVKYGLETKETVDAFEAMFDNYVPLAGLSVDEELSSPYPTGGAGLNVFGPTTRRAKGRKTEAENILAQVVAQNASIHIKARTNEALNALYNLVKENPNTKVWRLVDDKAGVDPNDPRLVAVRVNGEQKYIMFRDASYAQNLRGMNLPQTNAFIRALRVPAQWLRRSFTTLNPEFVISNFSRDIQAAIFNAAAEADIEGGMLNSKATVKRMIGLVPDTLKTLVKNSVQRGGDPAIEKYFEEFKEDGGKTGWAYAKSLDQIANELEGAAEDKTRTQEILGKAKNFAETIEGVNDAFENSIRLAAYIAAREKGVSRDRAAQLAKNITVNFNKQGEWGPALNAVYLFFNASIQGTARLGRSLLNLKPAKRPDGTDRTGVERITSAQWMAGGLMLFNAMLTMLGYAMSDEDEDGTLFWDKIPDYVKERNLIIMRPNGRDYFKIPMPYGFNVFANMGNAMVESANGGKEADEAMMFLFNSFMASFSPVSFGQSKDLFVAAGKGAVPTVMKPFVDIMVNETYFGGPVTGENLPFGVQRPESELSFRSPESVKDFFRWMNEATGGSEYKSGDVDINPDKFWYMFEYFIGGAGQFVNRSIALPRDMSIKLFGNKDIDIDANQIPLARILYGEPSKYYDYEKFNDNKQEFKSLYKEMSNAPVRDDASRYKGITEGANKTLNEVDKMMKMLRKAERDARSIPDYTERMIRIQEIRDKQRSLIMRWNKYYEQARD